MVALHTYLFTIAFQWLNTQHRTPLRNIKHMLAKNDLLYWQQYTYTTYYYFFLLYTTIIFLLFPVSIT